MAPTIHQSHLPPILRLRISTRIRINHLFALDPISFSNEHGLSLVREPSREASFSRRDGSRERAVKYQSNIHLVSEGAIRLFVRYEENEWWIQSIHLNPAKLLYGEEIHPLTRQDLLAAFTMLIHEVTPLLITPSESRHILPGLAKNSDQIAYWSSMEIGMMLPNIDPIELHDLSHPATGPAEGTSRERMQLETKDQKSLIIRLEKIKSTSSCLPDGSRSQYLKVLLILQGIRLSHNFRGIGTTNSSTPPRLVSFTSKGLAGALHRELSQLEGFHLPRNVEWSKDKRPATSARIILTLSAITSIPVEEVYEMFMNGEKPSPITLARLKKNLEREAGCLVPVPVAALFNLRFPSPETAGFHRAREISINRQVEGIYGESSDAKSIPGD